MHWAVILDPGRSEWLDDHEWRVPVADYPGSIPLSSLRISGIVIDSPGWGERFSYPPGSDQAKLGNALKGLDCYFYDHAEEVLIKSGGY